jgi:hypothetical protein
MRSTLPEDLHAAYDWTAAAGELAELRRLRRPALDAYCVESAANAAEHDAHVTADDLRRLATWLRGVEVGGKGR